MLSKIKLKPFDKGFIGRAKSSDRAPYRQIRRKSENRSFGKDSYFITPEKPEDIKKCPKGMKR